MKDLWIWLVVGVGGVFCLFVFVFVALYLRLWLRAYTARAEIGPVELIMMNLRRVNPAVIVEAKVMAVQAGLNTRDEITTRNLEAHYLAGGDVLRVVRALIASNRAGLNLDFRRACGIDLAGRDLFDAVRTSVNPRVIDCPDPRQGRTTIDAVAKDGIQLKAKARVTVRTNLDRLVGGATEETVIARVGEGIVSTIGSSVSYMKVLENPDHISKTVLAKGLDAGTAFEIVSIDIADVDVGENVGAKLDAERAETQKRVAQAQAEQRRAMAVAREQEMQALVRENRAQVVLAEAEVPKAISEAFRAGRLGVMDYYQLRNIQADTHMRDSIGGEGGDAKARPGGEAI
ncbi:MAG: flotillin-like protein FloA [Planctomycetes bacterium]|nr:flotillin-like protein FloA [Planctomycetota bacterium]